jgi:tellurite resistance protein TerA
MDLQQGQNTALTDNSVSIEITIDDMPSGMELDVSAFMLTDSGKVAGDDGFVFYGHPGSKDGSVQVNSTARGFDLKLGQVPASINCIAFAITIDKGLSRSQRFAQLRAVSVLVRSGADSHSFNPDVKPMSETALILAEVYRRNGQWKLRAVGQGFNGGLGPLARHFGVDISDDPDTKSQASPTPPPVGSVTTPPVPIPEPASAPRVNLQKITLEKSRPISLEKSGGQFGQIVVNLRWTKGGGLLSKAIDLDLGAMIELNDGSKAVVQALGKGFGDLSQPPFVKLMGDDRSGASGDGEFLHINGDHWKQIKRVLMFAFIYEGVPNWAKANGGVTIKMPGQPELEAQMDSPNNRDGMCAIAMLENVKGSIQATKHVEYFPSHAQMDDRFGFGFRWKAGSK